MEETITNALTDTLTNTLTDTAGTIGEATANSNVSQVIIDTINNLLSTLFSSIDNSVYDTLDNLAFINVNSLNSGFITDIFKFSTGNGIVVIANSLLLAVTIYYCFKLLYSYFTGIQIERPYQFVFKLLIFAIIINCSNFIWEALVYFPSVIAAAIREVGRDVLGQEISFSNLIQNLNSIITVENSAFNVFSFDGLIRGLVSFSFISLLFSYSLRYIMLNVLIFLTPFAFLTLINNSTSWFFKAWLKIFLSLLFVEIFISIVLLIVFALDFSDSDIVSKLLCVGSLYALIKANSYVQHFIGGISTDISANFNFLKSKGGII